MLQTRDNLISKFETMFSDLLKYAKHDNTVNGLILTFNNCRKLIRISAFASSLCQLVVAVSFRKERKLPSNSALQKNAEIF